MDPLIDPQMAEWLAQKKAELSGAYEKDNAAQDDEDRKALLMQFAQSYVNRRPMPVPARQATEARGEFAAGYGLERDAREGSLHYLRTMVGAQPKPMDPDNDPAPAEWGAPPGMTKSQAIQSGYAKKPDAGAAPETLEPDLVERAKKAGVPTAGRKREPVIADIMAVERSRESSGERREGRDALTDLRRSEAERKAREDEAKHYISDNFTPAGKPLLPSVQADLQKRASATDVVLDNAKQVEDVLQNGGPAVWGQRAAELSALINNIWTELKDIKNLGVLAGPDMGILQGIVADPSSMSNVLKDAAAVRQLLPQIQLFQRRMKADLVKRVAGYGARPAEGGLYYEAPAAAPNASAATGPLRIANEAEYAELPSGALYIAPGETTPRRKK